MDDYRWQVLDRQGRAIPDLASPGFPTQADAEGWLAEIWSELAEAEAAAVTLLLFEDVVYGPMSLDPPA